MGGSKAQTIDNMIMSEYNTIPVTPETDNNNNGLLECQHINVDTRDFSFKSNYDIYNQINDYYIFATPDRQSYLIIDASGTQKTWIYNYTEKTSCFYNGQQTVGGIVDLGPGLWIKTKTRYSQRHPILITLSCQTAMRSEEDDTIILWGLTEPAFITIIVVGALIIITTLIVGFCCWLKKYKYQHQYRYKSKKKKKKNKTEKHGQDSTDDDD